MKIDVVLMDLDGTVYEGDRLIKGAYEVIETIRSSGTDLLFFTNNSEKTRKSISRKINHMGILCAESDIISSGFISANYAKENSLKNVYVCGTEELREEYSNQNISMTNEYNAESTVIGMDSTFDYKKLTLGVRAAINSKHIISCNMERVFPGTGGLPFPGCGGIVAAVEHCSGKRADVCVGKPNTHMFDYVIRERSLESNRMLVIGDTYGSDIVMAKKCGAPYILVNKETTLKMNDLKSKIVNYL